MNGRNIVKGRRCLLLFTFSPGGDAQDEENSAQSDIDGFIFRPYHRHKEEHRSHEKPEQIDSGFCHNRSTMPALIIISPSQYLQPKKEGATPLTRY
jgi:hypothetical protein